MAGERKYDVVRGQMLLTFTSIHTTSMKLTVRFSGSSCPPHGRPFLWQFVTTSTERYGFGVAKQACPGLKHDQKLNRGWPKSLSNVGLIPDPEDMILCKARTPEVELGKDMFDNKNSLRQSDFPRKIGLFHSHTYLCLMSQPILHVDKHS